MKHYIGIKHIQAEPQEKDGKPGYKVVYPDGYVSWSPKEVFDEAYCEVSEDKADAVLGVLRELLFRNSAAGVYLKEYATSQFGAILELQKMIREMPEHTHEPLNAVQDGLALMMGRALLAYYCVPPGKQS